MTGIDAFNDSIIFAKFITKDFPKKSVNYSVSEVIIFNFNFKSLSV